MEEQVIKAISKAIDHYNRGNTELVILTQLRNEFPSLSSDQLNRALSLAINGVDAADSARSGQFFTFRDIPQLRGVSGNIRVRVVIQGWSGDSPFSSNIDVILTPADSISAVQLYAEEYIDDVLRGRVTLPGGGGHDVEMGEFRITISFIQSERDRWSVTQHTYGG